GRRVTVRTAVISGGNAEALAALFGSRGKGRGAARVLTPAALEGNLPALLARPVPARMHAYHVRRDRAEVMAIAALVLAEAARERGARGRRRAARRRRGCPQEEPPQARRVLDPERPHPRPEQPRARDGRGGDPRPPEEPARRRPPRRVRRAPDRAARRGAQAV